jgi:hypothetical protein
VCVLSVYVCKCVCVSCSTRYIGRTFKEKEANTELQNPDRGFWVLRVVNGGIAKGVSLVFE